MAGGIPSGEGVFETVVRECQEEAGIPKKLSANARPAGTIRYFFSFISLVFFLSLDKSYIISD